MMNIIYPPLVEQSYQFMKKKGIGLTKKEIYKELVKSGIIEQNGAPTKKALEEGLVSEFNREHRRLIDFKKEYPIFKSYPAKEFTQQEGVWYVSQRVLDKVSNDLDSFGHDEGQQVASYFEFRNYENPHQSIAEIKGVYHPLYTPYDDSRFQIIDDQVAIPLDVMEDIVERCERGELEVSEGTLQGFLDLIEKMEKE